MKLLLLSFPALLLAALPAAASSTIDGIWRNPQRSIEVRIAPCGSYVCGVITSASAEAEKDAQESGVTRLIGTEVLRNHRQIAPNRWEGHVFVPDMGGTYSSYIVQLTPNQIKVSGCVLGGWICKSQIWTRA